MRETGGWILPENVRTAMTHLAGWVTYDFDDTDWQAIEHALPETSWERPERWYDYPLAGSPPLTVWLAHDPGAGLVGLRVTGEIDDILAARVDTLLVLLQEMRQRED